MTHDMTMLFVLITYGGAYGFLTFGVEHGLWACASHLLRCLALPRVAFQLLSSFFLYITKPLIRRRGSFYVNLGIDSA